MLVLYGLRSQICDRSIRKGAAVSELNLFGYEGSTYTRMARLALALKDVAYDFIEVAAWDGTEKLPEHIGMHPFLKVPVLQHGDFQLFETAAITQYLDETFDGPPLQPSVVKERTRMRQLIGIHDNYVQPSWVRVLASQILFNPLYGESTDEDLVAMTWPEAERGADALEPLLAERAMIAPDLADIQLAPTALYFSELDRGVEIINSHSALSDWWRWLQSIAAVREIVHPTNWESVSN